MNSVVEGMFLVFPLLGVLFLIPTGFSFAAWGITWWRVRAARNLSKQELKIATYCLSLDELEIHQAGLITDLEFSSTVNWLDFLHRWGTKGCEVTLESFCEVSGMSPEKAKRCLAYVEKHLQTPRELVGEQMVYPFEKASFPELTSLCASQEQLALPDLKNVREILDSEIQAAAEAKIPGRKQAQKQYAKKYRQTIHRWSYARLSDAIKSQASQKGIAIECDRQLFDTVPEIQARDLALSAYRHRRKATG